MNEEEMLNKEEMLNEEEMLNDDSPDRDFLEEEFNFAVKQEAEKVKVEFPCKFCGKTFRDTSELEEHSIEHADHADERNFECDQCDRRFKTKLYMSIHKTRMHATEKPFQCEACPKSFATAYLLKAHFTLHSEERLRKCEQCHLVLRSETNLKEHMLRIHGKGGKFVCGVCGKSFVHSVALKDHLPRHGEERQHVCDQCGKSFKVRGDLNQHKAIHAKRKPSKEKPFQCDLCLARFTRDYYLKQHATCHLSSKAHKCDQCSKTFKTQRDLSQHAIWKHGEDRFSCGVCGKGFKVENALRYHLVKHSDERNFKCGQCDKAFKTKRSQGVHEFYAHSTRSLFQCQLCPKRCVTAAFLERHFKYKHSSEVKDGGSFASPANLDKRVPEAQVQNVEIFDETDVKVEPVVLYDSEVKRELLVEINEEIDVDVKQEPQFVNES